MRALKTVFYVGIAIGVVSLNVLMYRVLQEQRVNTAQLSVITGQAVLANAEAVLLRVQLSQPVVNHVQGN